jgi:CBS domain-containing protein
MKVSECNLIRPLSCRIGTPIDQVAKALREKKQRRILVVDEKDKPIGIISTTDISNKVVAENKDISNVKAEDVMTSPLFLTCDIDDELNHIYSKMHQHESFFCPVVKDKKLYGILTCGEIVARFEENLHGRN